MFQNLTGSIILSNNVESFSLVRAAERATRYLSRACAAAARESLKIREPVSWKALSARILTRRYARQNPRNYALILQLGARSNPR